MKNKKCPLCQDHNLRTIYYRDSDRRFKTIKDITFCHKLDIYYNTKNEACNMVSRDTINKPGSVTILKEELSQISQQLNEKDKLLEEYMKIVGELRQENKEYALMIKKRDLKPGFEPEKKPLIDQIEEVGGWVGKTRKQMFVD